MRYFRLVVALGLVAAGGLGGAMVLSHGSSAPTVHRAAAVAAKLSLLDRALQQQLQRLVATPPGVASPPLTLSPPAAGQTCFVGPGTCSITPCVVPVQRHAQKRPGTLAAIGEPAAVSGVAVLRPVRTTTAAPQLTSRPGAAAASGCPGGPVTPRTLRVVGR